MRLKKYSKLGNALLPMLPQDQTSGGRAKTDANDPELTSSQCKPGIVSDQKRDEIDDVGSSKSSDHSYRPPFASPAFCCPIMLNCAFCSSLNDA
jgi:hypothetical protein